MTEHQRAMIRCLSDVAFDCGADAAFIAGMRTLARVDAEIGKRSTDSLARLAWKYRAQIPAWIAYPITQEELDLYGQDLMGRPSANQMKGRM